MIGRGIAIDELDGNANGGVDGDGRQSRLTADGKSSSLNWVWRG